MADYPPEYLIDTPGKRSPNGRFLEYKFNRDIAARVVSDLIDRRFDAELLVPELNDISLAERCRRVNAYCKAHGALSAILVSIHANAFGNGAGWTAPHGWSVYTSRGQTRADLLADDLFTAAKKHLPSMQMRGDFADGDADYEEGFYVLKRTMCPAVLTENGFYTNVEELEFLETRAAKQAIVDLHVEGIIEYLSR